MKTNFKMLNKIIFSTDYDKSVTPSLRPLKCVKSKQNYSNFYLIIHLWFHICYSFSLSSLKIITYIAQYVFIMQFKGTLIYFTHTLSAELVVDWPMDVISVLMQKKVISNTTFEGNTMITIEVWQTILANKMITHKSSKLMIYEYYAMQLFFYHLDLMI